MPPVENPAHMSSNLNKRVIVSPGLNIPGMENLPKYAVGLFDNKGPGPRKRKRLTHLTPEEKIMRRKLKNRVAAQTARDRKKARVDSLEESVATLREQTKQLLVMNSRLLKRTEAIEQQNNELRKKLGLTACESNIEEEKDNFDMLSSHFERHIETTNTLFHSNTGSSESDDDISLLNSENGILSFREETKHEPCEVDKCGSPVPAAGSCTFTEADPLANSAELAPNDSLFLETTTRREFNTDLSEIFRAECQEDNFIENLIDEASRPPKKVVNFDHIYSRSPTEINIPSFSSPKPDDALIFKQEIQRDAEKNVKNNVPLVLDFNEEGEEFQDLFDVFKDSLATSPTNPETSADNYNSSWSEKMDTPSPLSDGSDQFFSENLFVSDLFPQLLAA